MSSIEKTTIERTDGYHLKQFGSLYELSLNRFMELGEGDPATQAVAQFCRGIARQQKSCCLVGSEAFEGDTAEMYFGDSWAQIQGKECAVGYRVGFYQSSEFPSYFSENPEAVIMFEEFGYILLMDCFVLFPGIVPIEIFKHPAKPGLDMVSVEPYDQILEHVLYFIGIQADGAMPVIWTKSLDCVRDFVAMYGESPPFH